MFTCKLQEQKLQEDQLWTKTILKISSSQIMYLDENNDVPISNMSNMSN